MKTENEKKLCEIAQYAYMNTSSRFCADWKTVTNAVIAEHERRKAAAILHPDYLTGPDGNGYGIGTGATYNGPPKSVTEGQAALAAAMADPNAECKAAFAAGKRIQYDYNRTKSRWLIGWDTCRSAPDWSDDYEYRVHPDDVEPKPDPFAAEKAALAQGRVIQYYSKSILEWLDCDPCPPSWEPNYAYRVKPEPVPYADKSSCQIVDLVESILKILKCQQP